MKRFSLAAFAALMIAAGCGGGGGAGVLQSVSMVNDTFAPSGPHAGAGTTVRWINADSHPHSVISDTNVTGLNSDVVFPTGIPPQRAFEFKVPKNTASGTQFFFHDRQFGAAGNGTTLGTGMAGVIIVN